MEPETCVRGQTHTIWGKHYCMKNLLLLELLSKYIKGVYRENYRVGYAYAIPNTNVHLCICISLENAYPG
jgi:hypothetical protein